MKRAADLRYAKHQERAAYLLVEIQKFVAQGTAVATWDEVGDMNEIADQLQVVYNFIAGDEESELPGSYESYDLCHRFG